MEKIYIVEDDENIREIERFALKNSGYEVKGFENGKDFWEYVECCLPDLAILDIMLPDEDGMSILAKLRADKKTAKMPVIMVTAKATELDKVRGLDGGADDYITKPFGVMELISRVKALLRRTREVQAEAQIKYENIVVDNDKHAITVCGNPCELTYKEYELIKYLIQNKGIVVSRDKLLSEVWGFEYEGETRTVDAHIKTLRQKLGEAGSCIKTIRNVGYMVE